MKQIPIKQIGIVQNTLGTLSFDSWKDTISSIIIDAKYRDALEGLEEFSHIYVLFYLHQMEEEFRQKTHPTGNPEYPLVGVFATRTPNRPSRIGLTICKLLNIQENVLTVEGLDAFNGSPVLDIKPFYPYDFDDVRLPNWIKMIHKKRRSNLT